jgi:hypothetical protein
LTAPALLREIEACGVSARVDGGVLKLRPASALDARVLAEAVALKPALIELLRERQYSQPVPDVAADALAALAREVEAARDGAHVTPTARVLAAWREAEAACGCALTLSGTPRRKYSNEENAGALYGAQAAEAEARRAFDEGEVTAAQRDTLLRFAGADVESAPLRLL